MIKFVATVKEKNKRVAIAIATYPDGATTCIARAALAQAYPQIEIAQRSPSEVFVDLGILIALKAQVMQALHA